MYLLRISHNCLVWFAVRCLNFIFQNLNNFERWKSNFFYLTWETERKMKASSTSPYKRYLVSLKWSEYGIISLKLKMDHIDAYARRKNTGYHWGIEVDCDWRGHKETIEYWYYSIPYLRPLCLVHTQRGPIDPSRVKHAAPFLCLFCFPPWHVLKAVLINAVCVSCPTWHLLYPLL